MFTIPEAQELERAVKSESPQGWALLDAIFQSLTSEGPGTGCGRGAGHRAPGGPQVCDLGPHRAFDG